MKRIQVVLPAILGMLAIACQAPAATPEPTPAASDDTRPPVAAPAADETPATDRPAAEPRPVFPDFAARTQFDETPVAIRFPASRPHVVTVTDQGGRDDMNRWIARLDARYGGPDAGVRIVGVATLTGIPGFARGIAINTIRDSEPDPVLLDFDGTLAESLAIPDGTPTLFVIARTGEIVHRAAGPPTDSAVHRLVHHVDRLINDPHATPDAAANPDAHAGIPAHGD